MLSSSHFTASHAIPIPNFGDKFWSSGLRFEGLRAWSILAVFFAENLKKLSERSDVRTEFFFLYIDSQKLGMMSLQQKRLVTCNVALEY